MSDKVVIRIENVSKQYRLGQVGTGTLSHDLKRWWALTRGQEDPYLKVGVQNDRTKKADSDYAWAVRDISFDVNQGDTLGIIGKNGAGKSTLLKLLSRVTSPTLGHIKIRGRIASLLEVGTGFNPELTGRENIFLNGAILGMTKKEISAKFDEIVAFAGVQMYIDTPVKRYSSGMYVRLAFGVAAHLEPEILIVDEVLAVGDAEFQKKCLGKMSDVAGHGRTVIFVSHNMQAVQSLCKRAVYLTSGKLVEIGETSEVINNYLSREVKNCLSRVWDEHVSNGEHIKLLRADIIPIGSEDGQIALETSAKVRVEFINLKDTKLNLSLLVYTTAGLCVFNLISEQQEVAAGTVCVGELVIPGGLLNNDMYTIVLHFVKNYTVKLLTVEDLLSFEVIELERTGKWFGKWLGAVRPTIDFNLIQRI